MHEIVSATRMRKIEDNSESMGVSKGALMDCAGEKIFEYILNKVGFAGRNAMFICGTGNNGGDALVAALHAFNSGAGVIVVMADGYPKSPLAIERIEEVKKQGIKVITARFSEQELEEALLCVDIIIDGVFGTGFSGELDNYMQNFFNKVNSAVAAVFSIDVPSGVQSNGYMSENCIIADFTLALDSAKLCHILPASLEACGEVDVLDIGIPEKAREGSYSKVLVVSESYSKQALPKRSNYKHKYNFGRVLAISGCARYPGAAVLALKGALYTGAGYVSLLSTEYVCKNAAMHIPEVTHIHINSIEDTYIDFTDFTNEDEILYDAEVLMIGSGLGKAYGTAMFLQHLLLNRVKPIVIDADAISALAQSMDILKSAKCPVIITPHFGEFAKLTGFSLKDIADDPIYYAEKFAKETNITVVLKGANTVISDGKTTYIYQGETSGLSKAGSGDLLCGMISGLLAQKNDCMGMAALAVYIHGEAAKLCSSTLSEYTMQPSDLKNTIGKVFLSLKG